MRARVNKRNEDSAAIEEAYRQLRPLFINVVSWTERGADTSNPKKAFRGAIAVVELALDGAEIALNEAMKCDLNKEAKDAIAVAIPFIGLAHKAAIPELQRARPRKGRHGQYSDLHACRNQTIAETVASIQEQFEFSQEQASWVVSEALKSLADGHRRVFGRLIEERGADPVWIEECLKFVGKLKLSEDTIEDIAKKYRT
jgi:hypothetical protein